MQGEGFGKMYLCVQSLRANRANKSNSVYANIMHHLEGVDDE